MKHKYTYVINPIRDCSGYLLNKSGRMIALTYSFADFVKSVFPVTPLGFEVLDAYEEGCYEIVKEAQGYSMSYYACQGKRFSFCKDGIYEELGRVPEVLYVKPLYV